MRTPRLLVLLLLPVTLAACGTPSDGTDDKHLGPVEVTTYDAIGEVQDPVRGKQVFFAYGAMTAASAQPVNGVASLMVFEDGSSSLGMQLNIALPPDGRFYEVWMYPDGAPAAQWKSLGHARSVVGDVRHALKTDDPADLRKNLRIAVTLESDDGNPQPSDVVVAKSLLKPVKR